MTPGKIIRVESTFHAVRDEHIKTIMISSKVTGSLKQEKVLITSVPQV